MLWPQGPACHHCGAMDRITAIKPNPEKRVRLGLKKCGHCKGQFTVRMGTIFEESKLPLHKWLQAIFLMCASKKGISAHQLHRALQVTYKTAWFLAHRIREAMRSGDLNPFGMGGATVEVDETFIGNDPDAPKPRRRRGIQQMIAKTRRSTRTPSKATSASSSGACAACTSTAPRSTCTGIWRSSTSGIPCGLRWAWTIRRGPLRR